jgi:nicotinamidase-related amidase
MKMNNIETTQLLVIDVQEKLLNAIFNKDIVEKKAKILVKVAEVLGIPITVTEQYPQGLGETISEIKENATIFTKNSFNALEDKDLLNVIKNHNRNKIIIFGIETHICVHQTVENLIEQGFEVTVIADACGSRSEIEYQSALNFMNGKGANVKTTEMVVFELLKTAKHPHFKEIQALIK